MIRSRIHQLLAPFYIGFALFLLFCAVVRAAESESVPALPKTTISAEARAKYWRTQAELQAAKAGIERLELNAKAAVDAMVKECGDQTPTLGKDGEPTCMVKE